VQLLVERYVLDAEEHFINRIIKGEEPTIPVSTARVEDDGKLDEAAIAKKKIEKSSFVVS